MITPDRLEAWRRTAAIAARTGSPSGNFLLDACGEIEELERRLSEIKRLAYMGGQNGEVVRGWIIGVLERANTLDPQGQQDIHVCSPQTCGAVYNQEEDE